MELNDNHHQNILNYLKFSKFRRAQKLRAVDGNFESTLSSRVSAEETYTGDEIIEILEELNQVVRADVESEFLDSNHTNCLLLRQLFKQAEKWHLKLNVDTSELENKALLDAVAKLEDCTSSSSLRNESKGKLIPLEESGPVPLLKLEISRLEEENSKLRSRLENVEMNCSNTLQEKGTLQEQVNMLKSQITSSGAAPSVQISNLKSEIERLEGELSRSSINSSSTGGSVPGDYVSTKHQLLAVQSQLEQTQEELDRKFSETTQYNNMKKMLGKKNEQLKEIRSKLRRYEPTDD
ncbi:leucine zipper transcription factor-like protein 1 [Bolinopsis microptera]|uniref:leucine zipper transcription factor-like protein 1 n=1 Tax=Bolinopsis microptera TaxID=2820187 RepID=UPI00307A2EEE